MANGGSRKAGVWAGMAVCALVAAVLAAAGNRGAYGQGPAAAAEGPELQSLTPAVFLPDGREFKTWEKPFTYTKTYYVDGAAPQADDAGPGTRENPFKTIDRAAQVLEPGQRVLVAAGVYREWVHPRRGGTGPTAMIHYQAAPGALVVIKGSRILAGPWTPSPRPGGAAAAPDAAGQLWTTALPALPADAYNPFTAENVSPEQFKHMDWARHLVGKPPCTLSPGLVFQDGKRLRQVAAREQLGKSAGTYWVDRAAQVLHVHPLDGADPNRRTFEAATQRCIFAPDTIGLGYRGGTLLFAVLLALVVVAYRWSTISRTALFWGAFILTRPLGAVLGDLLDKPLEQGGRTYTRTTCTCS